MNMKLVFKTGLILVIWFLFQTYTYTQVNETQELAFSKKNFDIAVSNLKKKPSWLFIGNEVCPFDVMPDEPIVEFYDLLNCSKNADKCLQLCKANEGDACYWLAVLLQRLEIKQIYYDTIFLKSCQLGVPSGCTNRAAGMLVTDFKGEETYACTTKTFKKTCEWDDPWGCTMFGNALFLGHGVLTDYDKALKVIKKSCKYGDENPACQNAKKLAEKIKEAKTNEQDSK